MRHYITFYLNDTLIKVSQEHSFYVLSDYLRDVLNLKATKVACKEGDCGACTILLGRIKNKKLNYYSIKSCITSLYSVDGCHVISLEGLPLYILEKIALPFAKHHGSQCGFCTPGFVIQNINMVLRKSEIKDIKPQLSGNICRCTGYQNIYESAKEIITQNKFNIDDLVDISKMRNLLLELEDTVHFKNNEKEIFIPLKEEDLKNIKKEDFKFISGGTDVNVPQNKGHFFLSKICSLKKLYQGSIKEIENEIILNAGTTVEELRLWSKEKFPSLYQYLEYFASFQVRHEACVVGNLVNASPIGDLIPIFIVLESILEINNFKEKKEVNINNFYKGYRKTILKEGEVISQIKIKPKEESTLWCKKISKRTHLDISSLSLSIYYNLKQKEFKVALGGVSAFVERISEIENHLKIYENKDFWYQKLKEIIEFKIQPISDIRGSLEYRKTLAFQLISLFTQEVFS